MNPICKKLKLVMEAEGWQHHNDRAEKVDGNCETNHARDGHCEIKQVDRNFEK
jgi:very-short-patch-repair endonuclease